MKRFVVATFALVLLAGACELDSGGSGGTGSGFGSFRSRSKGVNARQHRLEARRDRLRQQRRLARIERRREARLAALRRERRREQAAAAVAVAAPAPEPVTESCTDGYDPCLPPAADYDCEGGSGDGPAYTGYVSVTGYDPYDLDADGDGVGCES